MNTLALIGNILWIAGLATLLTLAGWQIWEIRWHRRNTSHSANYSVVNTGIFLFCLGIILVADSTWVRYLFTFLLVSTAVYAMVEWFSVMKTR